MAAQRQIYVGGLHEGVDEDLLRATFAVFGDIVKLELPPSDKPEEIHRGFAYITFPDPEDALAAIDNLDRGELLGREIAVRFATGMAAQGKSNQIREEEVLGTR